jgi:hypothetical protein
MINSNAPYSGLANIMNMRDRNPNTQLAYVPNGYLNSVPTAPNPYTGIPQVNSPIAMNEGGMPSMQYPMQEEAGQLADRGRYGDTTLVHMTPGEVQGLASLGQLTINPDTGLPEAFNLGSLLPMIANVGIAFATGGMSIPAQMAIMGAANFGMGLMQGKSAGDAALGGLISAAGSGIMSGISGVPWAGTGAAAAGAGAAGATNAAGQSIADLGMTGLEGTAATGAGAAGIDAAAANSSMLFDPNLPANALTSSGTPLSGTAGQTTPNLFERTIYNGGKGEGLLESYFSPNRSSIQPTQADITKAYADRAAELQIPKLDISEKSKVLENLKPGMLRKYGPLGAVGIGGLALTGAFDQEQPEQQIAKREVDSGFGRYTLEGGTPRKPKTQEELLAIALGGGRENMFEDSYYTRNAAEGGIVGLQQGGMATPQAPSAMSAMLAPPTQQQPMPMQQPMQQQPMPMPGVSQPQPQGIQPFADPMKQFMSALDMDETKRRQDGQQALSSMIGGAGNYLQSLGMNYPTTTPSGTRPQAPAINQGTQVNMGASGGFAQGGIINRADGGPTRQQFNDFMKNISNTPAGFIMRVVGLDKQFESQLSQGNAGSGAESMNQLLSRGAYSNNAGSSAAAPIQSEGGAASMNQLLSNPAYSKQLAMGGLLGYNEGGMPSQEQGYFEGQVVGNGDGQSDEVPFNVDGGEVDMAMLSPDEYVLAADVVSYIGDGSSNAGAAKLDQFMIDVRKQAHGSGKQIEGFQERGLANLVA